MVSTIVFPESLFVMENLIVVMDLMKRTVLAQGDIDDHLLLLLILHLVCLISFYLARLAVYLLSLKNTSYELKLTNEVLKIQLLYI